MKCKMNSFDPGNILSPKNLQLGPRLMVLNPFLGLKSRHLNSEDDFGMKTAPNRKNKTTFTPYAQKVVTVKVVLFFHFEAVFMPKTASENR